MKKLLLGISLIALSVSGITQTLIDSTLNRARPAQIAPGEFVYFYYDNDTLRFVDLNTTVESKIPIPQLNNTDVIVYHLSRNVFDADNGVEMLISYTNNTSGRSDSIGILDNGVLSPLPAVPTNQNGYQPTFINTPTGSFLGIEAFVQSGPVGTTSTYFFSLPGQVLLTKQLNLENVTSAIYPNPSNEMIKVPGLPNEVLQIYDQSGRHIMNQKMNGRQEIIDVSNFQKGVYIIRSDRGASYKFIKK